MNNNLNDWKKFAYGKNIVIGPFIHDNMLFGIDADGVLYKTSTKSGGPWTEVENLTKTFKISIIFSKTRKKYYNLFYVFIILR